MRQQTGMRHRPSIAGRLSSALLWFGTVALAAPPTQVSWNPNFEGVKAIKAFETAVALWDIKSASKDHPQLEVFDREGKRTHQLGVLRSVPQAESVGIWDLSVDGDGNVAVSAVFSRPQCQREPVLLLYGRDGGLREAIALAEGRSITRLEFDHDGSLWALGHHSGSLDPASVPMLMHYDPQGREIGAFVMRSQFPEDASFTEEGPLAGGAPGIGVTEDLVWFWLPASRRLATVRKDGSGLAIYTTGLPTAVDPTAVEGDDPLHTEVSRVGLLPSGELLAEARVSNALTVIESGLFRWTRTDGWTRFDSPQVPQGARLLHVNRSGDVILRQPSQNPSNVLVGTVQLR